MASSSFRGGRYRGGGRGGQGNRHSIPLRIEPPTVPLIGDWNTFVRNRNNPRKEDIPSSSSHKKEDIPSSSTHSYKDVVNTDNAVLEKEYIENPITETIFYIEEEDLNLPQIDGWSLKTRYLETKGFPAEHGKSRPLMEILLSLTESVTFTHHYQNNNPDSFINFSKVHINKVMLPREWGLNPNGDRAIRLPDGQLAYFNYWDYIQAFSKAFYYQNPKNKHSWFFSVNPDLLKKPIPNWFFEWWSKFGPSTEILPKPLKELYTPWCDHSPIILNKDQSRISFIQCEFFFFIKFQIPWIWRWSVTISTDKLNLPVLKRNFFYKWWKSMAEDDLKNLIRSVYSTIELDKSKGKKEQIYAPFTVKQMKENLQRKYPSASEAEIMAKILDHMKNQFCEEFPSQPSKDNDEDESMHSTSSQEINQFSVLAGEGQPEEPIIEDFWDSLIESIAPKSRGSTE